MKSILTVTLLAMGALSLLLTSCSKKEETYTPPAQPGYIESGK